MKKFLLLTMMTLGVVAFTFAQRSADVGCAFKSPASGTNIFPQVPFDITITISNNGPNDVKAGDTMFYQWFVAGNPVTQIAGIVLAHDITAGSNLDIPFTGFSFNFTTGADNQEFCFAMLIQNRADAFTDPSSTNNTGCVTVNFKLSSI